MTQPIVRIQSGRIEGSVSADRAITSFKGIPYAKPPLGALRWTPPQLPDRWDGVRPAMAFGPACMQSSPPVNSLIYPGAGVCGEDCLYLNVYTAAADPAEHRPVIVWIHHGGFLSGWSGVPMYDGSNLARAGAVVVTINYRLGRLGFLAHPALSAESRHRVSGNYGLMDQIAALVWVQNNIAVFGGDPHCVTLYGVSAGSFSISVHMASPLSKGLFHRAIGGSGGAFGPVSATSEGGDCLQTLVAAETTGARVMADIGARTAGEMRALTPEAIMAAKDISFQRARPGFLDTTYPIIDAYVLPSRPLTAFGGAQYNDVPLITGSNRHEQNLTPFNEDTESYLQDSKAFLGPFLKRFLELFPAGPDGMTGRSSRKANSDRLFSWQNWKWANLQAQFGRGQVFYYHFATEPPVPPDSVAEQGIVAHVGAFHSAEIPYVFRNLSSRDWPWRDADHAMTLAISGYWLDFARSGNPNGGGRPEWPAFKLSTQMLMEFNDVPTPRPAHYSERLIFWDKFYAWFSKSAANDEVD